MSHEIESMFYTGETPWHGLGNRVFEALSTEEAIKQAGLDWQVKVQPLYLADGRQITSSRAIVRETDGAELGTVGPRYVPLQNVEGFKFFNDFVTAGLVTLETAGSLQEGKKVWILARINDNADLKIVGDDIIRKYILLSNSHDGTTSVRAGFTPVRVVCANTLAMAMHNGESQLLRVKHSNKTVSTLEQIKSVISLANQSFEATAEQYRRLAATSINAKDLQEYVAVSLGYAADTMTDEDASTRSKNQVAEVIQLFETGRGMDLPGVKGTVWAAYNAVTEYLSHNAGNNAQNRYSSLWFGPNASKNKDALQGALALAA